MEWGDQMKAAAVFAGEELKGGRMHIFETNVCI